ncbi:GMC oxidoreductase-domain-containing protein [Mycena maculata]|uniref:GMC oxidoreductase-domain-containing protein n=1 Tax=Mycena maculata TaxID=230809 RepID=A0AAD7JG41_9AGAR|nr:GMC oxidoreductase-domain-containing protein [Mycena maculata]
MERNQTPMSSPLDFDIIFAGGGASGCLIAGRLAAADPSLRILIVEAGEHTRGLPAHTQPARYFSHLAPTSTTVTFNIAKPSENIGGRSLVTPSARCLGGGSSVNFTMYTRAAASDYDDWETVYGNSGWGSKDLIPLLKKTETYQVKPGEPTHGYSGPLKVSYGGAYTNVGQQFLDVAREYDSIRGNTDDINGLFSCDQYGRWQKWIDADTGTRSDVPHHFIYNQLHNQNLQVLHGCRVKRVIFENTRAVGVEFVNDTVLNPSADQTVRTAHASRLVVVSAGAFGSPTILERSGIGAFDVLKVHGVPPLVDLPGVGQNYQDHNVVFVPYLASEEAETLDALFRGDKSEEEREGRLRIRLYPSDGLIELVTQWKSSGTGLLAHNGLDAGAKLRPSAKDLQELGPEFETRWKTYFEHATDKPVIWIGPVSAYLGDPSVAPSRKYYSVGYYTQYPVSRGHVHISSGENANAPPDFDSGFLSDPADLATLKWGYKKSRELARRLKIYRGEYLPGNPTFADGSDARCLDAGMPVDVSAADIAYTEEDNTAIETYNRNFVQTAWHSVGPLFSTIYSNLDASFQLGTCAMKSRSELGVVDERLNVYGVQGLKVAGEHVPPCYSSSADIISLPRFPRSQSHPRMWARILTRRHW